MKKNLYNIITFITLAVPLPLYLFLSATLFNIQADYTFKGATSTDISLAGDFAYFHSPDGDMVVGGVFVYDYNKFGFYIDDETIIKTDDGYFGLKDGTLVNVKATEVKKEMGYKLPIAFFISALGVGIVALVVTKKMNLQKKYPRMAVLISLATGTLVLFLIDTIVSSLLMVFLIATISWGLYMIEYYVNKNLISEEDGKRKESDLITNLKEALK